LAKTAHELKKCLCVYYWIFHKVSAETGGSVRPSVNIWKYPKLFQWNLVFKFHRTLSLTLILFRMGPM